MFKYIVNVRNGVSSKLTSDKWSYSREVAVCDNVSKCDIADDASLDPEIDTKCEGRPQLAFKSTHEREAVQLGQCDV